MSSHEADDVSKLPYHGVLAFVGVASSSSYLQKGICPTTLIWTECATYYDDNIRISLPMSPPLTCVLSQQTKVMPRTHFIFRFSLV